MFKLSGVETAYLSGATE